MAYSRVFCRGLGVALFAVILEACKTDPIGTSQINATQERCYKPWIFFDLGDTIVDTKTKGLQGLKFIPGAYEYLTDLHNKEYVLGILTNIPENWGATEEEKISALKKFVSESWTDTREFPWGYFGDRVLVPLSDSQRKPAPFLFERAKNLASLGGCNLLFEGEDAMEVKAARDLGLNAYQVGGEGEFFPNEIKILANH